MTKNERLALVLELLDTHSPGNQKELLKLLQENGFAVTQATLSRDIKQLKIVKTSDDRGNYVYTVPKANIYSNRLRFERNPEELSIRGFISLEFSNKLGVMKTRPGYAMGIASDIDSKASQAILGTIAGDDTILLIPREGVNRKEIINALAELIPGIKS